MGDLMKQAKVMQEKLTSLQAEISVRTVEASAGGGMVTAKVNGKLQVLAVTIDPEIIRSDDREMLQDLVVAAVNEAIRQAQAMMSDEMSKLTGGLRIPGLG
ncbi:MAG: YbaB/EbfC family nucleoid-associated protein [Deltaproteobacteria bacterium]|nr:YbaB/EbfC family nucleoid-associated protein [Deltaproteobacteria bacterium]